MLFDVDGDVDRFNIFIIGATGSLALVQKLVDRLGVCAPGVLGADRDGEEFGRNAWTLRVRHWQCAGTWYGSAL